MTFEHVLFVTVLGQISPDARRCVGTLHRHTRPLPLGENEALKNPYKGKSDLDLKRKLSSFETQLADLIKKSRGRQRRDIEGEIRDMENKVQQVRSALKEEFSFDLTENAKAALQKKADKTGIP